MKRRIIFMGTTDFAAYILERLLLKKYEIVGVFSQPDRKQGRSQEILYTETKKIALQYNKTCYGFDNINEHIDLISELHPDIIITCAFGQKLSSQILNIPNFRCINVHASILPQYRGGAPIHHAIIDGHKKTGNTIMYMEEELDAGAIIAQSIIAIDDDDTTSSLSMKLRVDAANLLISVMPLIFKRDIRALAQDENRVSFAPVIRREWELINFDREINVVYNHIRGLLNVPGCYIVINNIKIKLHHVKMVIDIHDYQTGLVKCDNNEYFKIYALNGYIKVFEFQIAGKKRIKYSDYINQNKKDIIDNIIINEGVKYGYKSRLY
ncbi:MAG: methionyl-tRNA formyltransferase [Bacilli bacterium]|nr:methionyl-tRNA formyltransferase [Bacilli bacterium]